MIQHPTYLLLCVFILLISALSLVSLSPAHSPSKRQLATSRCEALINSLNIQE